MCSFPVPFNVPDTVVARARAGHSVEAPDIAAAQQPQLAAREKTSRKLSIVGSCKQLRVSMSHESTRCSTVQMSTRQDGTSLSRMMGRERQTSQTSV
jgi:hypothetical protein